MKKFLFFILTCFISGCGFNLQGEVKLAEPLHRLYIQAPDPYGTLARYLKQSLKMSKVTLVENPVLASTMLVILKDQASEDLISVSSTQQTRQYTLKVMVMFQILDAKGRTIVGPQVLTESRVVTVQASVILGSSNEANLMYQQMRRIIAYGIMNRIASKEITGMIMHAFSSH